MKNNFIKKIITFLNFFNSEKNKTNLPLQEIPPNTNLYVNGFVIRPIGKENSKNLINFTKIGDSKSNRDELKYNLINKLINDGCKPSDDVLKWQEDYKEKNKLNEKI